MQNFLIRQLELFPKSLNEKIDSQPLFNHIDSSTEKEQDTDDDKFYFNKELANTPVVPQMVYDFLPGLLKDACSKFRNERERDVFLTGALSVLSGVFSNVAGCYDGKLVYTNLYSFTVAPAASDKNALIFSKSLALTIHKDLIKTSKENLRIYLSKKKQKEPQESENNNEFIPKPKNKILFIPANSSSASVISHLEQCDERGIIVETEADTLANTFKQDWGGYSDLLRKAFHHEAISYSRKKEDEFIEIYNPRLSIALAGTPSQVSGLIKSASDGLFSRFLFYAYSVKQEWRDVSATNKNNLTSYFESLGDPVKGIYVLLEKFEYHFDLQEKHWKLLNEKFRKLLRQTDRLTGKDSPSTVKRLGLITYKIAMILTVLKEFELGIPSSNMICQDNEFGNAMMLTKVYFQHSLFMFESLNNSGEGETPSSIPITHFYNALKPNKIYKRSDLQKVGNSLKYSSRVIDKYLRKLVDQNLLHKSIKYGEYWKP